MVVQVVSCSKYVANAHLSSHARVFPPFLVSFSMRPFFSYTSDGSCNNSCWILKYGVWNDLRNRWFSYLFSQHQFSAMRKEVNNLLRFSNGYISEKLYLINTELTYEYYLQKYLVVPTIYNLTILKIFINKFPRKSMWFCLHFDNYDC